MRLSSRKTNTKLKVIATAFVLLLALGLIAYGIWGFWQWHRVTNNPSPIIPTDVITHSTEKPDETKPYCDDQYVVPAGDPRKIEISSIGVDGCVQRVGMDQNKAIAVPSNIHLAGWYTGSAVPGMSGLSIIDGHVLGRYNDAIFVNLKNLKKNDVIRIQLGDMSWLEFIVESIDNYAAISTMDEVYKPTEVGNRLVLITCSGTYDAKTNSYDKRVLVRATLVNS